MTDAELVVDVVPHGAWDDIANDWAVLAEESPYTTFFLTREWTESWLEVFGDALRPRILLFRGGVRLVGACLIVSRWRRRGPIPVRRLYLNTAGEDDLDSACIEFNNLLCLGGFEERVVRALAAWTLAEPWDELDMPGFCPGRILEALRDAFADFPVRTMSVPSYYINLEELRRIGTDYQSTLPRKVRQQLRQNLRGYTELGPLSLEAAGRDSQAFEWLADLATLHQESWDARGMPGSFSSYKFIEFHRTLIRKAFSIGGIQLLRVCAGGEDVGLLYNFLHRGKVYFYQCGFRYREAKRFKPGFVTHALAVEHAIAQGLAEYDMMAGNQPYKKELARDRRELSWLLFERRSLKMWFVAHLRAVRTAWRHAGRLSDQPHDAIGD